MAEVKSGLTTTLSCHSLLRERGQHGQLHGKGAETAVESLWELVVSPGWCLEEDQISQELPIRALFALLSPLDPAGDHTASL